MNNIELLNKPIILSLFRGSGSWEKPYLDSGNYNVIPVTYPDYDVRLFPTKPIDNKIPHDTDHWVDIRQYQNRVYGILAAPDCTYFANIGSQHHRTESEIMTGLALVDSCFRLAYALKPVFFALENPVGKLTKFIGDPEYKFQPYEFGDMYSKRTYLWGWFNKPKKLAKWDDSSVLRKPIGDPAPYEYYRNKIKTAEFTAPTQNNLEKKLNQNVR